MEHSSEYHSEGRPRSLVTTSAIYITLAVLLTVVSSVVAYFLLRRQASQILDGKEGMVGEAAGGGMSASSGSGMTVQERGLSWASLPSNMNPEPLSIEDPSLRLEDTGALIARLRPLVKGDGAVRQITVNGTRVPRELVEEAMFQNVDFMPPGDAFPLRDKQWSKDPSLTRPRSMFGPLTNPVNGMAFDIIR